VNACSTPAVSGKVPLAPDSAASPELPVEPDEPVELLDEQPAAVIEAAAATAQAASHRFLISVIA